MTENLNRTAYRVVLLLYPAELRCRFGPEMLDVFEQQVENASRNEGIGGVSRLWADVAVEVVRDAILRRLVRLRVPLAATLSSSALFLLFFWAAGVARHCVK